MVEECRAKSYPLIDFKEEICYNQVLVKGFFLIVKSPNFQLSFLALGRFVALGSFLCNLWSLA